VQKLRIEASKAMLENTAVRTDAIVERVGYTDASTFRRLFRKCSRLSPPQHRRRFGPGAWGRRLSAPQPRTMPGTHSSRLQPHGCFCHRRKHGLSAAPFRPRQHIFSERDRLVALGIVS